MDALRVLGILVVFLCHVGHLFDPLEGRIKNPDVSLGITVTLFMTNFWIMPLFFFIAGASARISLRIRTAKEFLLERSRRLIIPFLVGALGIIPLEHHLGTVFQSGDSGPFLGFLLEHLRHIAGLPYITPAFFNRIGGYLWFLAFLFVFSLLAPPLSGLLSRAHSFRKASVRAFRHPCMIHGLAIPPGIVYAFLRVPFQQYCDWPDLFYWFLMYLYGFVLLASPSCRRSIRRQLIPSFIMGCASFVAALVILRVLGVAWIIHPDYSPGYIAFQFLWAITTWSWLLFSVGLGMKHLDSNLAFFRRANETVLPFYLIHQIVTVAIAFFVVRWSLGPLPKFAIIAVSAFVPVALACEFIIRRVPILRFLSGMRPKTWDPGGKDSCS